MFFNTIALQITLITEQFQNSGHIALGYAIAKCTKKCNYKKCNYKNCTNFSTALLVPTASCTRGVCFLHKSNRLRLGAQPVGIFVSTKDYALAALRLRRLSVR